MENFCEDLFFFGDRLKNFCEDLFFWRAHLRLCPWPWPQAILFLASRVFVLGKAVLGLGFFFVSLALVSSLVSSTPPLFFGLVVKLGQAENVPKNVEIFLVDAFEDFKVFYCRIKNQPRECFRTRTQSHQQTKELKLSFNQINYKFYLINKLSN